MSESAQKKRKRADGAQASPQKKTSFEADKIKITTVHDGGIWAPALVFTPGLKYGFQKPMDVYTRPRGGAGDNSKHEILLHSADHPKLDYTAREESAGDAQSLLQHYIAVHDSKTGETQVVPVRKLVLRSTLQSARIQKEVEEKTPARKTAMESRVMLGTAFGTKKSQKALRSLTENAIVSPEKVKKDSKGKLVLEDAAAVVIDAMGDTVTLPTKEALQDAIDEAKPRPKANLEADTPADVYKLQDLAGKDILLRLDITSLKHAVKNKKDVMTMSRYFSTRLNRVADKDDKLRALKLLLTLVEWIKTFKTRRDTWMLAKDEDTKAAITDFDPLLMAKIKRKFAPETVISPWHMDNIRTHICALALIVDNYHTDTFDLKHDLSIETRKIAQYFREIGCRTGPPTETELKDLGIKTKAEANNHIIAKLRIPLVFPKMRAPMRRR